MNYNTNGKEGKDKIYSIYLIYNTTNGKLYVGLSKNPKKDGKDTKAQQQVLVKKTQFIGLLKNMEPVSLYSKL